MSRRGGYDFWGNLLRVIPELFDFMASGLELLMHDECGAMNTYEIEIPPGAMTDRTV